MKRTNTNWGSLFQCLRWFECPERKGKPTGGQIASWFRPGSPQPLFVSVAPQFDLHTLTNIFSYTSYFKPLLSYLRFLPPHLWPTWSHRSQKIRYTFSCEQIFCQLRGLWVTVNVERNSVTEWPHPSGDPHASFKNASRVNKYRQNVYTPKSTFCYSAWSFWKRKFFTRSVCLFDVCSFVSLKETKGPMFQRLRESAFILTRLISKCTR